MKEYVGIRMDRERKALYAERAAAAGIDLSAYLRRRLEQGDDVLAEITTLRRAIERLPISSAANSRADPENSTELLQRLDKIEQLLASTAAVGASPVQIETLLLLRSVVPPQKRNEIDHDLVRLGLAPWVPPASGADRA